MNHKVIHYNSAQPALICLLFALSCSRCPPPDSPSLFSSFPPGDCHESGMLCPLSRTTLCCQYLQQSAIDFSFERVTL